eukprot:3666468-Prymnesium_polylepis.1
MPARERRPHRRHTVVTPRHRTTVACQRHKPSVSQRARPLRWAAPSRAAGEPVAPVSNLDEWRSDELLPLRCPHPPSAHAEACAADSRGKRASAGSGELGSVGARAYGLGPPSVPRAAAGQGGQGLHRRHRRVRLPPGAHGLLRTPPLLLDPAVQRRSLPALSPCRHVRAARCLRRSASQSSIGSRQSWRTRCSRCPRPKASSLAPASAAPACADRRTMARDRQRVPDAL